MKRYLLLLFLVMSITIHADIIDNYGVKVGGGMSNQYWDYSHSLFANSSKWKSNKFGFIGQGYIEKNLGTYFSFKPSLGYIQKGYTQDYPLIDNTGKSFSTIENRVTFHDLSLDLSFKINTIENSVKPYFILGLRGDYLLDYTNQIIFDGNAIEIEDGYVDNFNDFTLGGIAGVGISYIDIFSFDIEFNPSFTHNLNTEIIKTKDIYFSATFGMNINELLTRNK